VGIDMTLCPIALAVSCKSCPLVSVCPAKSIIGDHKEEANNKKATEEKKKKPNSKK
jgi:hypothetical protein